MGLEPTTSEATTQNHLIPTIYQHLPKALY